jgi:ketosteroid isomerase-like protein
MKTRRITLPAALLIVASLIGTSLAKDNTRESALRAAEIARFKACVDADDAALDRLLDADLQYTHSNGDLEGKSRFIAALHDGTRDYVAFEPNLQTLRVIGNVGLIHGEARVTVASGKNTSTFGISFDDAWLWKDGRWQMTSWRSTRPPDAAMRSDAGAKAAVLARFDAALRADVAALDYLLADDLDYCTFRGDCLTKTEYIDQVKSGRLKYRNANNTVSKVKMFADSAVVTGTATVTVTRDGKDQTIHISWSALEAWRDARWQLTTWTSTLLEGSSK